MKILVVEDEGSLANLAIDELATRGHQVTAFRTVGGALEALGKRRYDVALIDWDLGLGGCGGDVLIACKASDDPEHTRTVLWSGLDRTRDIEKWGCPMPDRMVSKVYLSEAFDVVEGKS